MLESATVRLHLLDDREQQLTRQLEEKTNCIVTLELKVAVSSLIFLPGGKHV